MPIYEYRCSECGKEFEMIRKFSDRPLKKCIHCSGPVEKLISRSSFHLKGGGWYATDYAGKGKTCGKADKSSPDARGDDKPAKKPECAGCPAGPAGPSAS